MWANLSDIEKMRHLLETPVGEVPCDEKCGNCPIGTFSRCGDDVAYKRASSWLRNMEVEQEKGVRKMTKYIQENLADLAMEILDWKSTGILHSGTGGKLRILARMFEAEHIGFDHSSALSVAETMVCDAALDYVIKNEGTCIKS